MFDDPKMDLKWLEDQLLAEEDTPCDENEDVWAEEEDWLDDELKEAHALMDNDYSGPARPDVTLRGEDYGYDDYHYSDEEEEDEDLAVYADVPSPRKSKKGKKPKKEKGIGGLVFLACLETLGIIAVLLWWVLWLL